MSSSDLILTKSLGKGVTQVTFNDPEVRNAMGEDMAEEFKRTVDDLRSDSSLRVVVLRGAGDRAFSAGGNLDMLLAKTKIAANDNRKLMEKFYHNFLSLRDIEVPVIAAINGHAVGAGMCVALACDIRIAKSSAKLGLNFVRLGLHPGMGATYFLEKVVGPAKAAELLFTGNIISAEEAAGLGMVNQVVEADAFETTVTECAEQIALGGPDCMRQLKLSLRMNSNCALDDALRREAECQANNYAGEEFLEGISAAKEKRAANFKS